MLGTAYESWCILTVGFYIRLFEFRIAPCRWFAYVRSTFFYDADPQHVDGA